MKNPKEWRLMLSISSARKWSEKVSWLPSFESEKGIQTCDRNLLRLVHGPENGGFLAKGVNDDGGDRCEMDAAIHQFHNLARILCGGYAAEVVGLRA